MKKTVISILLAFLILSTTACSNSKPASGTSEESSLKHDETTLESENAMAEEPTENRNDFVSAQFEIGDIILADGSTVKEADLTTIDL